MNRKASVALSAALSALGIGATANAAILLSEPFTYNDGALETVSGGLWQINSGTGSKVVSSGKLIVDDNTTSDYQRQFNAGATSTVAYSSFKVVMSSADVPNSAGSYFAGVAGPIGTTTAGTAFSTFFRGRVGALVTGTEGAGKFTLAISAGGNLANGTDFTQWGTPLNFDTEYTIVTKVDAVTGENRLWVNPTLETDTSVVNTGATSSSVLGAFLWRTNSSSIDGDKTVDDLNVGTLFADVVGGGTVPEPTTAGVLAAAGVAAMLRRRRTAQ
jgi:hypothetical protein